MRLSKLIISFLVIAVVNCTSYAADKTIIIFGDAKWLDFYSKSTKISVVIDNQTTDSCMSNDKTVKNAIELEFKRSGYKVVDGSVYFLPTQVYVFANGYKLDVASSCVVAYRLSVRVASLDTFVKEKHTLKSMIYREIWSTGGIFTGPSRDMNFRLKQGFVNKTQSFLNEIDQNGKEVLKIIATMKKADKGELDYWANYK